MKIFWKIVIVVVIVAPLIICWKTLQTVWDDDELASSGDDYSYRSGDLQQIKDLYCCCFIILNIYFVK